MAKLEDVCRGVVGSVDGGLACCVVDLESGILLGIHNASAYPSKLNDVLAAATLDMFRGTSITRIEHMVRQHRGVKGGQANYLEEVQLTSRNNHHFAKCIHGGRAVLVLVTRRTTSAGLGWAALRTATGEIEAALG